MDGIKILQFIPPVLSTNITVLDVSGNIITNITGAELDRYPLLERV